MKIRLWLLFILCVVFGISCLRKNNNNSENNSIIIHDNTPILVNDELFSNIENNDIDIIITNDALEDYEIKFEINNYGVYSINENYYIEKIIDQNANMVSCYENILFFRNTNWFNYFLYNYITKEQVNTSFHSINQIKYLPENKVEIIGKTYELDYNTIILEYNHNNDIDKIIQYNDYNDINLFIDFELYTFFKQISNMDEIEDPRFYERKNDSIYIANIFDKNICFNLNNDYNIEIYYNYFHKVYFFCIYSSVGSH